MALVNSGQGLPYPDKNETVNDVHNDIKTLVEVLDKRIVGIYANQTAVSNAGPWVEGNVVWVQDSNTLQVYNGSSWVSIYPSTPRIYSGTSAPSSALGNVGDFYVQY